MKSEYAGIELKVILLEAEDIICNSLEPDWKLSMADKSDIEMIQETN